MMNTRPVFHSQCGVVVRPSAPLDCNLVLAEMRLSLQPYGRQFCCRPAHLNTSIGADTGTNPTMETTNHLSTYN